MLQRKPYIQPVPDDREGYTCLIFLVPKSESSLCPVLNLKSLNRYVITHQFKMESIRTVKGLMQRGGWLVKLDFMDAYLHCPHTLGQTFKVLPFGLSMQCSMHTLINHEASGAHTE